MKTTTTIRICCSLLLCGSASAQNLIAAFHGANDGERVGRVFASLGDVNGDNVPDMIVGDPSYNGPGLGSGRAFAVSGVDGSRLWTFDGDQFGDHLGKTVAGAGDVNADGIPDALVGSPDDNLGTGSAYVLSGDDGSELLFMRGINPGDNFAICADGVGDVNGDGHDDVIVGAPGMPAGGEVEAGRVYVYSGATGLPLHALTGFHDNGERFGSFVSAAGDPTNDGNADFLAGSSEVIGTGTGYFIGGFTRLYSGATGAVERHWEGWDNGHGFDEYWGMGGAALGDIDGDGIDDYLVGVDTGFDTASVRSGATGQEIRSFNASLSSTSSPPYDVAGDVNGDGVNDVIIAQWSLPGIQVYSGTDGALLQSLAPPAGNIEFGVHFEAMGDIDGDGLDDVGIGAPLDDSQGANHGVIFVYSANPGGPDNGYCVGASNSVGAGASIHNAGSSSVSANDFVLRADDCPSGQAGVFYFGSGQQQTPFFNGFQCVAPPFTRLPTVFVGVGGSASQAVNLNVSPGNIFDVGESWSFQFWYRDPAGGGSFVNLSNGMEVNFRP